MSINNECEPTPSRQRSFLAALCWVLLVEVALAAIGAALGVFVYLPGPLDGWFYFHMIVFGTGGLLLGVPVSIMTIAYLWRK